MRSLPLVLATLMLVLAGCSSAPRTEDPCEGCEAPAPPSAQPRDRAADAETPGSDDVTPPRAAAELKNTLRWKTASEVDNFGFDVYRGLSEDGPFERLTTEPIPGAVTTDEPQQYVFEDDRIESGVEYWYYIESISMGGIRERFTPVFKAKAKELSPVS